MKPVRRRRLLLLAALLFTLWATWQVSQDAPSAKVVAARKALVPRGPAKPTAVAPALPLVWPQRTTAQTAVADVFTQVKPPQPVALPATDTTDALAPQFRLKYVGRLDQDNTTQIFLADGADQVLIAQAGQTVDTDWQLSAIQAQTLVFRHIMTGYLHTLQTGTSQ